MKNQNENNEEGRVYLDLEVPEEKELDDETTGLNVLGTFLAQKKAIGKRAKEINSYGIFYPSRSVNLFQQAKTLYILGLYESSIMVCRSTVEYIVDELFKKEIQMIEDKKLCDFILNTLDFRKILNEYLFPKVIQKTDKDKFNDIYDRGNKYVHPKGKQEKVEDEAKKTIILLRTLILSLKTYVQPNNTTHRML